MPNLAYWSGRMGDKNRLCDAPVVASGKACKKSTATVWAGDFLIHALICQVLVDYSNDCDS